LTMGSTIDSRHEGSPGRQGARHRRCERWSRSGAKRSRYESQKWGSDRGGTWRVYDGGCGAFDFEFACLLLRNILLALRCVWRVRRVNRRQNRGAAGHAVDSAARWRGTSIRRLYGVEKARKSEGHERQEQRARQRHYAAWEQILKADDGCGVLNEAQGGENEGAHVRGPGNRRERSRSANSLLLELCNARSGLVVGGLAWYQRRRRKWWGRLRGARAQRWERVAPDMTAAVR